uniref:thioredoxin-dependent peroxiredoxin n=1 Tax=Biomphalaria glabrata TaxID=6526 RepID=B6DXD9_BIOGL|nr:peroxiredoxin 4 variant precursor [Biomphalaria glabrata]
MASSLQTGLCFVIICLCAVHCQFQDDSCHSYAGGQVYPQETKRTIGHTIQWSQAVISKPAPDWNGTAVIKGEFKDITHEISKAYGVYLQDLGHSLRGLFIIDPKGTLRQITMNDLPVGRSVDETLRLVQAFQYTDKHGEVCPAGWKPGSATIIPDPKKSKEYFKQQSNDEL